MNGIIFRLWFWVESLPPLCLPESAHGILWIWLYFCKLFNAVSCLIKLSVFFFFFCTKSHGRFINIGWSKRKINFSKKKQQSLIWISINMCKTTFPFFKWLNGRKYDQLIRFCSSNFLYITKPKSVKNQFSFYS